MSESHGFRARSRGRARIRDATVGPLVRGADLLLPTSNLAADELLRLGGRGDRMLVLPHVPDPAIFHPPDESERTAARARFGADATSLLVAYAGRLVESKDVATLVEAAAALRRPHRLVIAGDGPVAGELRAVAHEDVVFTGFLPPDKVGELLRAADVFVLPSRDEPFGTVALEAAACGLPVFASTAVPAAHELLRAHRAARLFEVGDVAALAGLLERLDSQALRELRADALAAAAAYTPDRAAEAFAQGVAAVTQRR